MTQLNKKSRIKNEDSLFIYEFMPKKFHLKGNSLIIYALIYQSYQNSQSLICNLSYLCQWTGSTKQSVIKILKELENKNLIKQENHKSISDEEYFNQKNKEYKNGCLFCGTNDIALDKHHYPIRRRNGGIETISLCPNCHSRFHYNTDYSQKIKS